MISVGLIGCGDIAAEYVKTLNEAGVHIAAVAGSRPGSADAFGARWSIPSRDVAALLDDSEIEAVLNLTPPQAHAPINRAALAAGKHVYCEKPLGINAAAAREQAALATERGLALGSAPDTFLGAAHQVCRRLLDEGAIGTPLGGTAMFLNGGHERRHPAPAPYYRKGGGPVRDIGPYYLTVLHNLLGPITETFARHGAQRPVRQWTNREGTPHSVNVEVPTHVTGALTFGNGAVVTLTLSYELTSQRVQRLELFGSEGTLTIPDPIFFGGDVHLKRTAADPTIIRPDLPYAAPRHRGIGLVEMMAAHRAGRVPLTGSARAIHLLDVMDGLEEGGTIRIGSTAPRPEPFDATMLTTN